MLLPEIGNADFALLLAGLALLLVTLSAAPAAAEGAMLLEPGGDPSLVRQQGQAALHELAWRLNERGIGTTLPAEERSGIAEAMSQCDEGTSCMETILDSLGVDFGVRLGLWRRARGQMELAAVVHLRDGSQRNVSVPVTTSIAASMPGLADLVVAQVRAFSPAIAHDDADVADDATGSAHDASAPTEHRGKRVSGWNYVLGSALVLGAAALIVPAAITWARDGQCVDTNASGQCVIVDGTLERYSFDTAHRAMLGAGIALAVGGVVVIAARPIRVGASVDGTSLRFQVRGEF